MKKELEELKKSLTQSKNDYAAAKNELSELIDSFNV